MSKNRFNTIECCIHKYPESQQGAVLLLMLVILIMGGTALLLNSLNSTTPRLTRDKATSDALAQAKEALIGRAVSDANRPGSMRCPDTDDDGIAELLVGNDCPTYIGRLPWKTLGITDLRDGSGERLWYALSKNFRDDDSNSINSDTLGTLSITGNTSANYLIAIIFSPGANTTNQSRSAVQTLSCTTTVSTVEESNCATNYLEGINANSSPPATPNTLYTTDNNINDQLIYITTENLLPIVEKRIARETKSCLDDYAAMPVTTNGNLPSFKYPWAAPLSSLLYNSTPGTLFGRIPDHPSTVSDILVSNMVNAINALQASVDNCKINNTATNRGALDNAGDILKNAAVAVSNNQPTTPLISGSITSSAATAGTKAKDYWRCENINNHPATNIVQQSLDQTNAALAGIALNANMSLNWPASCTLFSSSYWSDWKDQVFFQIADGYQPHGDLSCAPNCLSVSGTGNSNGGSGSYRAAVALAGKNLSALPRPSISMSAYLDGSNSTAPASLSFSTYRPTDPNYPTLNDVVICLDGKNNCK